MKHTERWDGQTRADVLHYLSHWRMTPEQRCSAEMHAWRRWVKDGPGKTHPLYLAFSGARAAKQGRDLPGMRRGSGYRDAFSAHPWQGFGMDKLADRSAGPARLAEVRELVELLYRAACSVERRVLLLLAAGLSQTEIATRTHWGRRTVYEVIAGLRARCSALDPQ